ncbi:MAG: ABC transporter permease, partial [Terrimonas sp.]|nr:ABC transporter permease [Terrimonas sp.]
AILIISTIIIAKQLRYMREKDIGYDKEYVFTFNVTGEIHNHYQAFRNELLKQPGVRGVASSNSIVGINATTGDTDWEGKDPNRMFLIHPMAIDENLIGLLKMQLTAGTSFTGSKADSAYVILNETAVKNTGIKDPVGKPFTVWQTKGTQIGVVKDINYASLKQPIEPMVFYYSPANWKIYVKTTAKDAAKSIAATEKIWKQYSAAFPFSYSFIDEEFNNMYKSEQRTGKLFTIFGVIAILISCLGLFGLAAYTAQVRVKEMGIRKVLGASVLSILHLMTKDFLLLVFIALVIAIPVSWFATHQWLQNFAYRTDVGWWVFLLSGLLLLFIALLTVTFQTIRAALANPVKSLRTE